MIDIHCHILPDVDDGATDLEEAVAMARMAADCGVSDIIATPHFRGSLDATDRLARFVRRLWQLEKQLEQENIPVRLHHGAEILCLPETVELAMDEKLPTLGHSRYVLCEFYFDAPYEYMDRILSGISNAGYKVVVAHPERYDTVVRDPRRAERWFYKGYVLQMNKGSVLGAFGQRIQETAQQLLERGFVHMIASDAHSPRRRTTDLSLLREWLLERYSQRYVQLLLKENPGRLLGGMDMAPVNSD